MLNASAGYSWWYGCSLDPRPRGNVICIQGSTILITLPGPTGGSMYAFVNVRHAC
jgi:hypothetical protein